MKKLKYDNKALRSFGAVMGIAFGVISLLLLRKHNGAYLLFAVISVLFIIFGLSRPLLLKYIYIFWMRLAYVLGWVNARILIFIIFYILLTPVALIMKLFRLDLLNIKIDKDSESYWIKKPQETFQLKDYENQF